MLLPPDNFGLVEEGIYRCSKLDAINFAFLETLQLKSIVLLDNESPVMKNFQNFMTLNKIETIRFENQSINTDINENNQDWMVFNEDVIRKVFKVILNKNNCNLLIVDKTNVIVGLLRKACKWIISSIVSEYRLYSGKNSNYFAETFLELSTLRLKSNISFDSPPPMLRSRSSRNGSLDYNIIERRFSEDIGADFDEDENEENLLSASPQVPKTLLRQAELRKQKIKTDSKKDAINDIVLYDDFNFYLPLQIFKNINPIEIVLPKEYDLPDWFKHQRNLWEEEFQN
ncbi:hypothetical protein BN7_3888 [Wickerhamomyces ciferrii]|uniref:Uncharacterized protein n=1 Tax=Wickerhamomyces ciferrii (strain ATCC 14091 / BCRC 22168 / CBS 111 / JCM 3599 / NBRC 0793 / NRRL Y-1031 F-60-10) TaxID=1206466 RepID=K0KMZ3_WICCF|nr:uncharacterized protein BN7_3888 [Wickerhamomyces ciferrii]CCH44326.1 hypothetical protein BN7_3888 [Wickerhamomyces ciferrii]